RHDICSFVDTRIKEKRRFHHLCMYPRTTSTFSFGSTTNSQPHNAATPTPKISEFGTRTDSRLTTRQKTIRTTSHQPCTACSHMTKFLSPKSRPGTLLIVNF
ncbi:unnamed protein product, partial [Ectocarpus sp. 4 AP-2014]